MAIGFAVSRLTTTVDQWDLDVGSPSASGTTPMSLARLGFHPLAADPCPGEPSFPLLAVPLVDLPVPPLPPAPAEPPLSV